MNFFNEKIGNKKNFSTFEIFIVLAVIGLLMAVSLIILSEFQSRARDAQRLSGLKEIQKAVEMYRLDNGEYPGGGKWGGLYYEANSPSWISFMSLLSGYLADPISDPLPGSDHQYYFYSNGVDYKIRTVLEKPSDGLHDPRYGKISRLVIQRSLFNGPDSCAIDIISGNLYVKAVYSSGGACFGTTN